MKLSGKTIAIVAVVGIGLWYFTTQSRRLDIGAAAVSRLKLEGANLRINVKIPVINRSDFSVPISSFLGSLLYNGSPIGTTQLVSQTTLPGRSQTFLEFSTLVSLLGVATSTPLLSLLNSLAQKFLNISLPGIQTPDIDANTLPAIMKAIRIRGTLYLGAVGFDIDEPLTV